MLVNAGVPIVGMCDAQQGSSRWPRDSTAVQELLPHAPDPRNCLWGRAESTAVRDGPQVVGGGLLARIRPGLSWYRDEAEL